MQSMLAIVGAIEGQPWFQIGSNMDSPSHLSAVSPTNYILQSIHFCSLITALVVPWLWCAAGSQLNVLIEEENVRKRQNQHKISYSLLETLCKAMCHLPVTGFSCFRESIAFSGQGGSGSPCTSSRPWTAVWLVFVLPMFEARCMSFDHLSSHCSWALGGKLGPCPSDAQLRNGLVAI